MSVFNVTIADSKRHGKNKVERVYSRDFRIVSPREAFTSGFSTGDLILFTGNDINAVFKTGSWSSVIRRRS